MKHTNTRTAWILTLAFTSLLVLLPVQTGNATEYYLYQAPDGRFVISDQKPPPGSKIIRQRDFSEDTVSQPEKAEPEKVPPNGRAATAPKPSNNN